MHLEACFAQVLAFCGERVERWEWPGPSSVSTHCVGQFSHGF